MNKPEEPSPHAKPYRYIQRGGMGEDAKTKTETTSAKSSRSGARRMVSGGARDHPRANGPPPPAHHTSPPAVGTGAGGHPASLAGDRGADPPPPRPPQRHLPRPCRHVPQRMPPIMHRQGDVKHTTQHTHGARPQLRPPQPPPPPPVRPPPKGGRKGTRQMEEPGLATRGGGQGAGTKPGGHGLPPPPGRQCIGSGGGGGGADGAANDHMDVQPPLWGPHVLVPSQVAGTVPFFALAGRESTTARAMTPSSSSSAATDPMTIPAISPPLRPSRWRVRSLMTVVWWSVRASAKERRRSRGSIATTGVPSAADARGTSASNAAAVEAATPPPFRMVPVVTRGGERAGGRGGGEGKATPTMGASKGQRGATHTSVARPADITHRRYDGSGAPRATSEKR